jgi:hypothetical protein
MRNKALITALLLFICAVLLDGDVESTGGLVSSETSIRNPQKSIQLTPARNADCPDLNGTTQSPYFNINIANSHLINAGCPEIDGEPQYDPDGTIPAIGTAYYRITPGSTLSVLIHPGSTGCLSR